MGPIKREVGKDGTCLDALSSLCQFPCLWGGLVYWVYALTLGSRGNVSKGHSEGVKKDCRNCKFFGLKKARNRSVYERK